MTKQPENRGKPPGQGAADDEIDNLINPSLSDLTLISNTHAIRQRLSCELDYTIQALEAATCPLCLAYLREQKRLLEKAALDVN